MDNNIANPPNLSIVNSQLTILKGYFPELTDEQKVQIDALFDLYSDSYGYRYGRRFSRHSACDPAS